MSKRRQDPHWRDANHSFASMRVAKGMIKSPLLPAPGPVRGVWPRGVAYRGMAPGTDPGIQITILTRGEGTSKGGGSSGRGGLGRGEHF